MRLLVVIGDLDTVTGEPTVIGSAVVNGDEPEIAKIRELAEHPVLKTSVMFYYGEVDSLADFVDVVKDEIELRGGTL